MSIRSLLVSWVIVAALAAAGAMAAEPAKPKDGPLGMKFVPLPKATFFMGWDGENAKGKATQIKQDFELAAHPVTQGQWEAIMGKYDPLPFTRGGQLKKQVKDISDADLPQLAAGGLSWDDAQAFLKKLNAAEQGKGWTYRLPSEAEWEYACRGGATTEAECSFHFYFDEPTNDLSSKQANFNGEFPFGNAEKGPYLERPTKVGSYAPNKLGLYDMHGNIAQWCADAVGDKRMLKSTSFDGIGERCRAAYRNPVFPTVGDVRIGFRVARVADSAAKPGVGPQGMTFVPLPKATFFMGWDGETEGQQTQIDADFAIAATTVTQGQWQAVMGANPSNFSHTGAGKAQVKDISDEDLQQFPVEMVSWNDAQDFLAKVNAAESGGGYLYRLPTSAEWEYACRAGATTQVDCSFRFYLDKPTNDLSAKQANFLGGAPAGTADKGPNLGRPAKVGSYAPNKLGLYDMHGNMSQWCAADEGAQRQFAGSFYGSTGSACQAANRGRQDAEQQRSYVGLRLVRVAAAK